MGPILQKHLTLSQGEMTQGGNPVLLLPKEYGEAMETAVVRMRPSTLGKSKILI